MEVVSVTGLRLDGYTTNISMSGLYFATSMTMPAGASCWITMNFEDEGEQVVIKTKATVVRAEETGMAFTFNTLDDEGASHLRRLIEHEGPSPSD